MKPPPVPLILPHVLRASLSFSLFLPPYCMPSLVLPWHVLESLLIKKTCNNYYLTQDYDSSIDNLFILGRKFKWLLQTLSNRGA